MKIEKFNLEWFRKNKEQADRILNFNQKLLWFKQNVICKINNSTAEFYLLDKEKKVKGKHPILAKLGSIRIEKPFVYAVDPLRNEKVWLLAERLGYYKFPRTWQRISKWFAKEFVRFCFKTKNGKLICYLKDKFGNRFYLPNSAIEEISSISKKLNEKEFKEYANYLKTRLEKNAPVF